MAPDKRIALTFDDAPNSDDPYLTDEERTSRLINALARSSVSEAVFFCVTNKLDDRGIERLRRYGAAGHLLANHTHDHCDAATVAESTFIDSVKRADELLRSFPGFRRYFRFPFLSEGGTPEKRAALRQRLRDLDYVDAYVTVPTLDWYLQGLLWRAFDAGRTIALPRVGAVYTASVLDAVSQFDAMAIELLRRSPSHILLLHENDLAALFLEEIVEALRGNGWTIVTPDEAYGDALSTLEPRTCDGSHGRIAALAADRGWPAAVPTVAEQRERLDRAISASAAW